MQKFGNIVTKSKVDVDTDLFNIVESCEKSIDGIPTLYIGLDNAKEHIPGFNILNKQYGDTFWTFKKNERKCEYDEDVDNFQKFAISKAVSSVKYIYIDFLNYTLNGIRKLLKIAGSNSKKVVFLTKGSSFMFVYMEEYDTVFGVSLSTAEYIGVPKGKIIKLLRNAEYIHDTTFITGHLRRAIGFNTHIIPILYSKLKQPGNNVVKK